MPQLDGRARRTLATLAALGDTEELRAEAETSLPPGVGTRPPDQQEVVDPTGTVRVVVDARGRVQDVGIDRGWRHRLAPDELVATLFDTYLAATRQAAEAWAQSTLAAVQRGEEPPRSPARESDQLPPAPSDRTEWWSWYDRSREQIYAEREARRAGAAAEEHQYPGPHGYLAAVRRGGRLAGVVGDPARIHHADTDLLREDAIEVLSATDAASGGPGGGSPATGGSQR